MELVINGERQVLEVSTIMDVIEHYGLTAKSIIAEVDGSILQQEEWVDARVKPGMRIELVHFVGGG